MVRRLLAAGVAVTAVAVFAVVPSGAEDAPVASGAGWFHADCRYSHSKASDPIVFPGQADTSHLHDFFGNRSTGDNTTNESLAEYLSSCVRDDEVKTFRVPRDRSAYWVPAAYNGNGQVIRPTGTQAAYTIGKRERNLQAFPPGYRVIAGVSSGGPQMVGSRFVYKWLCGGQTVTAGTATTAPTCSTADLRLQLNFPDCWDGASLDSGNHRSHAAYAQPVGDRLACPQSHPVAVPALGLRVTYPTTGGPGFRLATGSGANRTLGDLSTSHGDFMNGWVQAHLERLVDVCLNADEYCGGQSSPVEGH